MARRDDNTCKRIQFSYRKGKFRCRAQFVKHVRLNAVFRERFSSFHCKFRRLVAGIVRDHNAALFFFLPPPPQLEDCFYKKLEFGTAGMRGEIGPGPNRMNVYTVRKA